MSESRIKHIKAGEIVRKRRTSAFIVRYGKIEAYRNGVLEETYEAGDMIGDIALFMDDEYEYKREEAFVFRAQEDTTIVELVREHLQHIQGTYRNPTHVLSPHLAEIYIQARDKYERLRAIANSENLSSRERNKSFLEPIVYQVELYEALLNKEFTIFPQMLVDIKTGRPRGVECLARWIPAGQKPISPARFIPQISGSWCSREFGNFILREGFEFARKLKDTFDAKLFTSINVSPDHIDADLVSTLDSLKKEYHIDPQLLKIEITEEKIMEKNSFAFIREILHSGFSVALDDYGTGNSNLSYIAQIEPTTIKFDKLVLDQAMINPKVRNTLTALVNLFSGQGYEVIIEGIGDEDVHNFVLEVSPNVICQGYYYAMPLPAHETLALIERSL